MTVDISIEKHSNRPWRGQGTAERLRSHRHWQWPLDHLRKPLHCCCVLFGQNAKESYHATQLMCLFLLRQHLWGIQCIKKKIVKHEHLCKQPVAFCGICKRPFQKKDWRPQNTLSSPVEFISHKTTLKEVLRYLDVQVYRCVLQIPLCTMKPPHHFFASLMAEGISQ